MYYGYFNFTYENYVNYLEFSTEYNFIFIFCYIRYLILILNKYNMFISANHNNCILLIVILIINTTINNINQYRYSSSF